MRMAETSEKVSNFLSDLTQKMAPLGQEDLQCMLELKAEEVAKHQLIKLCLYYLSPYVNIKGVKRVYNL